MAMHRDFERMFPRLIPGSFNATSPKDGNYNCVGWVLDKLRPRVWWPDTTRQLWPDFLPLNENIKTFIVFFQSYGYELCEDDKSLPGFEKIALYVDEDDRFSHVAHQLENGKWTSKLAAEEDIEHGSLQVLTGPHLGKVWGFMKRRQKPTQ